MELLKIFKKNNLNDIRLPKKLTWIKKKSKLYTFLYESWSIYNVGKTYCKAVYLSCSLYSVFSAIRCMSSVRADFEQKYVASWYDISVLFWGHSVHNCRAYFYTFYRTKKSYICPYVQRVWGFSSSKNFFRIDTTTTESSRGSVDLPRKQYTRYESIIRIYYYILHTTPAFYNVTLLKC